MRFFRPFSPQNDVARAKRQLLQLDALRLHPIITPKDERNKEILSFRGRNQDAVAKLSQHP